VRLRGDDDWGSGRYKAPRGNRRHNGIDVVISPGDIIESLTYGVVTKIGWCYSVAKHPEKEHLRYVQVTLDGNDFRYFYTEALVAQGDKIKPGDSLGIAHDLQPFYPGITDHYHFEIIDANGEYADPAEMIPEIKEAMT
jgi:murein DD-endopeptidase MepM/ murein hydrolase activator NlpD